MAIKRNSGKEQISTMTNAHDNDLEIYGTFGPSCRERSDLERMLTAGMNGIRLNLSHSSLRDHKDWIENLHRACQETGRDCTLVIDLQGRERRLGRFETRKVKEGDRIRTPEQFAVPTDLLDGLQIGDLICIGDGDLRLRLVEKNGKNGEQCCFEALDAGLLEARKAIHLRTRTMDLPICSQEDLINLREGRRAGVQGVLVPFVQSAKDLQEIRTVLERELPGCRILAKIENLKGVSNLETIIPEADMIVIARGDLGSSCSLEWLPAVQSWIESVCRSHQAPYLVVTQMLESMREHPVPTRPEVNDIYQAVFHGASAIMLTGETASGLYPCQAMEWMCRMARIARQVRSDPNWIDSLLETAN